MQKTTIIPMIIIPHGIMEIDFYKKAFNAIEVRRFSNEDGSIHVSELTVDGVMFRMHEENVAKGALTPAYAKGITTNISLMVADVDAIMANSLAAGATLLSAAQDYDYGYRQGEIKDIFGHRWTIEAVI